PQRDPGRAHCRRRADHRARYARGEARPGEAVRRDRRPSFQGRSRQTFEEADRRRTRLRVRMRRQRRARRGRLQVDPPRRGGGGCVAVVVGVAKPGDSTAVRTMTLPFEENTLTGSYFGSCVPRVDFPRMLALYMGGRLKLDELITRRYSIGEAPQAFADLESGRNARGVIVF